MGSQAGDIFDNPASRLRYEAYSRLQVRAAAGGGGTRNPRLPDG